MHPILAVVLNWNGAKYLRRCIDHLHAQTNVLVRIVVVDNGSTDGSLDLIRGTRPSCELVRLAVNVGFAEGMNAGMRKALAESFDYVWLINTDAFAKPDCLSTLLDRMERESSLVMVTPRLLSEDGTEQHAGGTIDWSDGTILPLWSADLSDARRDLPWLTGTAPLIRTSALRQVGLFEPAFFAYWEDVDLSIRLRRAGGGLATVPGAVAIHLGNASSGADSPFVQFLETRNTWLFLDRNAVGGSKQARWLRFVARSIQRAAVQAQNGKPALATAVLAGVSAAREKRFGRPEPPFHPATWDRCTAFVPWEWGQLLRRLANVIDPLPAETQRS